MSIYSTHKPAAGEGGGLYLKIADGETVRLRIASEPAIYESENERDGKIVLTTRYGWKVFNQDAKAAQILQQSATFFKSIAALAQDEEWGDPQEYDIKVSRKGTELETKYTIVPSTNRDPLDSEAREAVEAINLIDKLNVSQFNQRVMWLSEWDDMASKDEGVGDYSQDVENLKAAGAAKKAAEAPKSGHAKARETADSIKTGKKPDEDVVIEDIGDEPINLDDIPW